MYNIIEVIQNMPKIKELKCVYYIYYVYYTYINYKYTYSKVKMKDFNTKIKLLENAAS